MESNSEASCISDPNFAVICAFLERFASSCGITYPPFLDLQEMLENSEEVPQDLIELHIILLRKARRSVFREKWEKALVKFCHTYSTQDGWEIERFGYKNSRLEVKLRVLKTLLEGQFDLNCKFKTTINSLESTELRSKPLGKDKLGRIYWLQVDPTSNIRVYREDLDEESWTLVAKDRDSLVQLLQELSADEESVDVNLLNEDSSVSVDIEKTILDTGQENGISDNVENGVVNGEEQVEEKDPLEIKVGDETLSDIKNGESHSEDLNEEGRKRMMSGDSEEEERELKKFKPEETVEVSEAVEEPVVHVYGEGNGADCDAGNPDKEDGKPDEGNASNAGEQAEPSVAPGQANAEMRNVEIKPTPKLWSIDTICGTGSFNHSAETSKSVKSDQKNFSSFSIESVLEKKTTVAAAVPAVTDSARPGSPLPDSPVISLNTIAVNNAEIAPAVKNVNQISDQVVSIGNLNVRDSESVACNATGEGTTIPGKVGDMGEEEATTETVREPYPIPTAAESDESAVCAEKERESKDDITTHSKEDAAVCNDAEPSVNEDKPGALYAPKDAGDEGRGKPTSFHNIHEMANMSIGEKAEPDETTNADGRSEREEIPVPASEEEQPAEVREEAKPIAEVENDIPILEDSTNAVCEVARKESEDPLEPRDEEKVEASRKEETELTGPEESNEAAKDSLEVRKEEVEEPSAEKEESHNKGGIADADSVREQPPEESVIGDSVQDAAENEESTAGAVEERDEKKSESGAVTEVDSSSDQILPKSMPEEPTVQETKPDQIENAAGGEEPAASSEVADKDQGTGVKEGVEGEEPLEKLVPEKENTQSASSGVPAKEEEHGVEPDATPKVEEQSIGDKAESLSVEAIRKDDGETAEVVPKEEPPEVPSEESETVKTEPTDITRVEGESTKVASSETLEDDKTQAVEPSQPSAEQSPDEIAKPKEEGEDGEVPETVVKEEAPEIGPEDKEKEDETKEEDGKSKEETETQGKEEDDGVQREDDDSQTQTTRSGKKRKLDTQRRNRKQSGEDGEVAPMPARATRSAKKSVDEEVEAQKPAPAKRDTRVGKRKSQDQESCEEKESQAADESSEGKDAGGKKPQKRRSSTVNSVSDDNSVATQEDSSEVGGKRIKMRGKKTLNSRIRESVEDKRNQQGNSSEDEKKPGEEAEATPNENEAKKKKSPKTKPKDGTPRVRQLIPEREIKLLGISNMEELPTVRQSRRIAQLKLKEEAERNRLKKVKEETKGEEDDDGKDKKKKKKASKSSGTKKKKKKPAVVVSEDDDEDEVSESKAKPEKRKKKKKDKLKFNELNPWISSSGSSSADEEEEEIEDDAHEEEEILFKSDHEFSPESDIEDPDYKPIKRARTAKVDSKDATGADSKYDDTACEKCGEKDHPEWILLCDKCDKGWHASCVRPALMVVPEGDWFCPPCEHTSLVQKLRESLVDYDRSQKQRENEELRKKRLAFVGISLDNVLPTKKDKKPKATEKGGESDETGSGNASGDDSSSSGSSSSDSTSSDESTEPVYQLRERRTNITSYRYNEYDELIKSALQEEIEAVKGVGLGKGKDITNQARPEGYDEEEEEDEEEEDGVPPAPGEANSEGLERQIAGENAEAQPAQDGVINPNVPRDVVEAKPRVKPKKKDADEDYEADSDEERDEEYNEEGDEEVEEEDEEEEELADEVPPVVPRYDKKKKKKKSRSLTVKGLDFTSDEEEEEDNSDSDFKGGSSEEESEFSLPSESESSDGVRRKHKNYDGPVRRSTRARTARYDKEFINDDSEEETPRRKKSRNVWVSSESSDSDRSWGRRKKKSSRSNFRSGVPKKKTKSKGKKKKNKKRVVDSENEDGEKSTPKKPRNRKIKYGGLDDLDEEQVLTRRTRGKKINYQEMNASDSDDDVVKRKPRVLGESDEEFVAEKEKSDDTEGEGQDESEAKVGSDRKAVSKKSILQKMKKKKKKTKVIPDPDDFSEDDLAEDEELDEFAEELEDLDEEEEEILKGMLSEGDVPIHELKSALRKLKERRKERTSVVKSYPPIPEHMENPGRTPRFPKIEKMTPAVPAIPAPLGVRPESIVASVRAAAGGLLGKALKDGEAIPAPELPTEQPGNLLLLNEQKTDLKEALLNIQPPPYPFSPEVPPMVSPHPHPFPLNNRPPMPPFNSFQGMITPHARLPPEYPHPNIPTTVLGLETNALQKAAPRKPVVKAKRKTEDGPDSGEENSGDGRLPDVDSPPKRRGRGRGKKQLLAEAQAKQELGISTVQAPTQFPPQGLPPEGGSVITRMLNTPQGPQPFPYGARPPFRSPFPNALRPPLNPPSPSRLRTPGSGLFHPSHPLDPSSSGLGLPQAKPSPLPPGFARPPLLPRYPSDPSIRPPFPSSQSPPPRSENFPYPNFFGPYPPPIPNSEDAPPHPHPPFHNPNFPNHPFDEQHQPAPLDGSAPPAGSKPTYEEEAGGEFGGLASYFASQREDDLDT